MSTEVEKYLKASRLWKTEIVELRNLLLKTKLEEGFKWKKPCYSFEDSNVAIIQPFKSCLALMFFKGSLLKDPKGVLVSNGPNSQAGRRFEFRSIEDIRKLAPTLRGYIKEAIQIEKSGAKVVFKKKPEPMPPELLEIFTKKVKFKKAFHALTPGRQRGYILHFSGAKQSATRVARIEKVIPKILEGRGMNDR